MRSKRTKTVVSYIASCPKPAQAKLKQLRAVIRKAAPKAEEHVSYGMPYYAYKGRLAYFGLAANHIGLYIPPPVIREFARELKGYTTATATVQLPLNRKLPVGLIRKLITARMRKNDAKAKLRR